MTIEIIKLPVERWAEYKALRLRALKDEPRAFVSRYDEQINFPDEKWQTRVQEAADGKSWMLFAETEGKLVGMAVGFQTPEDIQTKTANIASVFVVAESRGQGISKNLMTKLEEMIKTSGRVIKLKLEVNKDQLPAVKLYEALGYSKTGEQDYLMGDGKTYTEYVMEKIL